MKQGSRKICLSILAVAIPTWPTWLLNPRHIISSIFIDLMTCSFVVKMCLHSYRVKSLGKIRRIRNSWEKQSSRHGRSFVCSVENKSTWTFGLSSALNTVLLPWWKQAGFIFHSSLQGYASEMDNPNLVHLIPSALQNKKEILFGNLPEIYYFHNRYMGTGDCPASLAAIIISSPSLWGALSCSQVHWQEKSSSLSLCVCPIKPMCTEHLEIIYFIFFLVKTVPFVHLPVVSPGRIHFECPLWSVFYHLSWYTGRWHRTKSWYFLSGKTPL